MSVASEPSELLIAPRFSLWKSRWLGVLLIICDALALVACWLGGYGIRSAISPMLGPINTVEPYLTILPLIVCAGLANYFAFGLYSHRRRLTSLNRPSTLIKAGYHWLLYIIVIAFLFKELELGRSVIVFAATMGIVYLFLSRSVLRALKTKALRRGDGTIRALLVGATRESAEVATALQQHPEVGYRLVGRLHLVGDADDSTQIDLPLLGEAAELPTIVDKYYVEEIFLAVSHLSHDEQFTLLNLAERRGVSVHVVSDAFGVLSETARVDEIATFPVVTLRDGYLPFHEVIMKRILDVVVASLGIVFWLLFLHWWICLRIKASGPGPIFFKQERVGKDGVPFIIYKYRTMKTDAPVYALAPAEEDDPRITTFGRWLRRTSLDELPQLLNVLRGEMSMVGPRPEMRFIVEKYEPWQRRRLDAKPGVTGLWQVIGRKNLPLHLNMQYDLYYIRNQSLLLDLEILLRTIPAVLKGKGAF